MKAVSIILIFVFAVVACNKSHHSGSETALPFTGTITNGAWSMSFTEGGTLTNLGTTTFGKDGNFVTNKGGSIANGTWKEIKDESEHSVTLNISSSDVDLLKANGTWRVIMVMGNHIEITDPDLSKRRTVHFKK